MKKYLKNFNFTCGLIIVITLFLMCIISLFYIPYNYTEMNYEDILQSPSIKHIFGTDNFGRDIFSRIMQGSKTTFLISFFSVLISSTIGIFLGSFMGYYGGIIDKVFSKFIDVLMAFPSILFALVIISVLGSNITNTIIVLGILSVPRFARLTRSSFIQGKNLDYVKLAKIKGVSNFRIIFVHMLPNFKMPLIINASFSFALNVLSEAGLSYLGLGIQPPEPSWGRMLKESQNYLQQAPWYVFFTGFIIFILALGFNLLGDGINDILEEK